MIAKGTFGAVALVKDACSGAKYAVKKILRGTVQERVLQQQLLSERASLAFVKHPFICELVVVSSRRRP